MELWDGVELRRRAVWGASLEADVTAEVIDRDSFDRPVLSATVIQYSPDGKRLAAATRKGLEVYSVADAEQERTLTPDAVACFAFSPDAEGLLAVRAEGKGATVFDLSDGSVRAEWPADPKEWACLCWSPDGKTVASGGADGLIRLWDPATDRELARWQAQESPVTALAYSPDGDFLVSGGRDGTLKVWNLPFIRKELAALGLDW
jgi:WD40 repeat protein